MTLKQRLEQLDRQQVEILTLLRQLAKGSRSSGPKGKPADDETTPRRWNQRGGYFELFLPGSGWIRDHDPRPKPGDLRAGGAP
jgi:hypothetical protein